MSLHRSSSVVLRVSRYSHVAGAIFGFVLHCADLQAEAIFPVLKSVPLPPSSLNDRICGFERIDLESSGLTFAHQIPAGRSLTNQMLLDGSGVALSDVDGDGRVDIFLAASNGGSQLWQNLGNWKFRNITEKAFPGWKEDLAGDITSALLADLNGDARPDLILNSHGGGLRILLNDGKGSFKSLPFSQSSARGGHSVAVADVDGDGWLDIYVCNYRRRALMDMPGARATFKKSGGTTLVATLDGRPTTDRDLTNRFTVGAAGELEESGEPDVLYRNKGGTNFVEIGWTRGAFLDEDGHALTAPPQDWGLAAQFCDVNEDGRPDLYVCNDFQSPDRFWINESSSGQVRFRLAPRSTLRHTSHFSMGVDFADLNRDRRWDFVVVDMLSPEHLRRLTTLDGPSAGNENPFDGRSRPQFGANTLFIQRNDGSFSEVANFAGIMATDWSWTPAFLDVDLDGWPDLLITAGQERGSRDLDVAEQIKQFRRTGLRTDAQIFRERQKFPRQAAPLKAFRNRTSSEPDSIPRFEDVSSEWGFDFNGVSHGMALGDLDGDGDLDVVVNHLGSPVGLYRNVGTAPRAAVRLHGRTPNTAAIGARLRFWWQEGSSSNALPQTAQVAAGGRYLSSDDGGKTFACPGTGTGKLEVLWPSGQVAAYANLAANRLYDIEEPTSDEVENRQTVKRLSLGKRLRFDSIELPLPPLKMVPSDFAMQPSLPRLQSTRSPVLAMATGSAKTNELWVGRPGEAVRELRGLGQNFSPAGEMERVRNAVAILTWGNDLIVASDPRISPRSVSKLALLPQATGSEQLISTSVSAISCLALDRAERTNVSRLFVGGGASPGDYPNCVPSELLQWDGATFQFFGRTNLGLVTGAVFAELDGVPGKELVTVSEWGAPRIFRGEAKGAAGFVEWDPLVSFRDAPPVRFGAMTGWWQSVAAADIDRDGRTDLLLGNWGLNSAYALYTGPIAPGDLSVRKLTLAHGELGLGGRTCIESYLAADGRSLPLHGLKDLSQHLPWLGEAFPTYRSFALADTEKILGDKWRLGSRLECRWLCSIVLLNRGDHFEAWPLPDLAQLGPIFALGAGDFDGDGFVDFYATQGFFGYAYKMGRDDAGEGVFLLGRSDGKFDPMTTVDAGFRLLGEQRSVLCRDLNDDGKPDLIVGEYGGPVTLLLNRRP